MTSANPPAAPALHRRALVLPAALLVACAALPGGPHVLTVTTAELSARLAERLPPPRRVMEVFDAELSDPRVRMLPDRQRLRVDLRLRALERLLGRPFDARISIEAGLRWDAGERTLRLVGVEVDAGSTGQPGPDAWPLKLGAALAAPWLEDLPVYRLSARDAARVDDAGFQVSDVVVRDHGLEIRFSPRP